MGKYEKVTMHRHRKNIGTENTSEDLVFTQQTDPWLQRQFTVI
jgi:hypothetical protein